MNSGLISDNRHMIGELSSDLDVVRAGVAASIALSRMPSVDGGGISFGAGTYAGEMAYAVGFQVQRGFGTFDIGVTSSGGEIGAGVGLKVWHWGGRRRGRCHSRTVLLVCQTPISGNAAGFGDCSPAGAWLRWNPYRLQEATAGNQSVPKEPPQ